MDDYYHTPTPQDVYSVRHNLLHFLPAELVNIIIEEAKYWPKISCQFKPIFELRVTENEPRCRLVSPVISGPADFPNRITEVHFKIESHDQGWGGEQGLPGPYDGSYTWFEAVIVRDFVTGHLDVDDTFALIEDMLERRNSNEMQVVQSPGVYVWTKMYQMASRFSWIGLGNPSTLSISLVTVRNSNTDSDVWEIQRNLRASSEWQSHRVVWRRDVDMAEKRDYLAKGSSMGADFVNSLRPGDRIAVLARAQYAEWTNFVKSISIDIFFSV
ncbi:hypothetical protein BDN70DRAFT_997565 [Pholiota conissans]|uniref:Uncharacterized protein n=1 Tax=Pholiota conissans TaxID=109636 RepID=A0A9P5YRV6_9AGAR|nr:hypothetical protein BDN70DRAFT_997565 [Pholiota conissans]